MTPQVTTTLRLRRVRFKDGRTLDVIRPKRDVVIRDTFRTASGRIGTGYNADEMAGFAIVTWSRSGMVCVRYENSDSSSVAACQVPQYVKDCLLAEVAVKWARDE